MNISLRCLLSIGHDERKLREIGTIDGDKFTVEHGPKWLSIHSPLVRDYQARQFKPKRENRPRATIVKAMSAVGAMLAGKRVSLEVMQARLEICRTCEHVRVDAKGLNWCSRCGCGLSDKSVLNLAAFVENLPHYGCKHPERSAGKGWPIQTGET